MQNKTAAGNNTGYFSDAFRKIFKPFYSPLNGKDANYLYTALFHEMV
jgi:hypothetical protein